MKKKKIMSVALLLIMLFMLIVSDGKAYLCKAQNSVVKSVLGESCRVILTISGKTAKCEAKINGTKDVTSISGTMKLYKTDRGSDAFVKSWTLSGKTILNEARTYSVSKGKYKLVLSAWIRAGNKTDAVVRTATATC